MHESSSSRRRMLGAGSLAVSLGLSLFAGQLVGVQAASAAPAATTALQAAAAQRAAAKSTTKVTLSVNRKSITHGSAVKLTAKVVNQNGKAVTNGGTIRLQANRGGKWTTWQNRTLPKSGVISVSSKPVATVQLRMVFMGNGSYKSDVSNGINVRVSASGAKVLAEAAKHKGALYKYGAAGPSRFDCSGFTLWVFKKTTGRKLPHKANSQQRYGKSVSKSAKKAGDLIVFRSGSYGYHAAVYAGGGLMWDSPRSGARVSKRKMISTNYVVRRLV